jgi:hypothetical protein
VVSWPGVAHTAKPAPLFRYCLVHDGAFIRIVIPDTGMRAHGMGSTWRERRVGQAVPEVHVKSPVSKGAHKNVPAQLRGEHHEEAASLLEGVWRPFYGGSPGPDGYGRARYGI